MRFETALVVDDEPVSREILRHILEIAGLDVTEAPNGQVGLALALEETPDLVVTDLRMPGMNGVELASRLRKSQGLEGVSVVAVTRTPEDAAELRLFDLVLQKPVSTARLRAWVEGRDFSDRGGANGGATPPER